MPREYEYAYCKSKVESFFRPSLPIVPFIPSHPKTPSRRLEVVSAWVGLEDLISDIIEQFNLGTKRCLEFGVEHGFSTVALSSYFDCVTGVDIFTGDRHTNILKDIFEETKAKLAPYNNIQLIRSDYQDFIRTTDQTILYDLSHVDIIHTFADTYACGLWSAQRSTCTLFHDTESFPAVKHACREVARATGKRFYNYPKCFGLGIIV
jgi:hypothetical protein